MFLLCNGLLVFVGITRSFSGPSGDDDDDENSKNVQHDVTSKYVVEVDSQSQFLDSEGNEPLLEKTIELDEENIAAEEALEIKYCVEEVEEKVEKIISVGKEQEKESDQIILEVKEPEDEEEKEVLEEKESEIDYFMIEENIEEDGDEIEEENCISTEELNKKFDDFIRRMKEDLRIEAKQQLFVMV
ncbi:hypothetical protein TanjilG_19114 [Lupinus angustifolius]|uniref:DUF4408 domain-containing protein n=2 Tax=Lupinus angustifolius TaxID=3871 RepID=A0A4P1RRF0_LUPAN|nr:hypothetical protein TanjilG_19114 [Lupinus angustifolius]